MENKRIVDINIYWAEIIRDTAQFGQIAVAENPEFNRLSECIFRALEDSFIHSGSEYTVKRWENMLQIAPSAGETLEERKARILTYLNLKLPYTWRVLKQLIENIVGADKVALDLINDESKLVVHGDRLSDEKWQTLNDLIERVVPENLVIERYNHHIEVNWRDINKYAHCNTIPSMVAVNPDYKNDLTADGEWVYPLPNMALVPEGNGKWWFRGSPLRKIYIEMPRLRQGQYLFRGSKLEDARVSLSSLTTDQRSMFESCPLKSVYLDAPKLTVATALFAAVKTFEEVDDRLMNLGDLTQISYICFQMTNLKRFSYTLTFVTTAHFAFASCPNFSVFEAEVPNLNVASNMFRDCILNKDSALRVLNSIPTWTDGASHPITMGIHVDYQNDADVRTAIDNAAAKGWTVTEQWNGTPTSGVSTLDLEEIYATVEESEYGEYTDENGNRCMLSWGHDVKSPDGKTPAELGYKLFFSLVEAEQYFKLTKIEGIENE